MAFTLVASFKIQNEKIKFSPVFTATCNTDSLLDILHQVHHVQKKDLAWVGVDVVESLRC